MNRKKSPTSANPPPAPSRRSPRAAPRPNVPVPDPPRPNKLLLAIASLLLLAWLVFLAVLAMLTGSMHR